MAHVNFWERLRLLPLLILVAFLAFSVRVVDVVSGFYSLSAVAYAVEGNQGAPTASEAAQAENPASQGNLIVSDDKKKEEIPEQSITAEDVESLGLSQEKPVDWLDSTDSDLEYSDVRMEIFKDLAKRRKELDDRQQSIATREALLRAAEKELDQKYKELIQLRNEIEGLLDKQSKEEAERLNSLVRIYEGMKAKEAARIFDTLDLDVLVAVMGKMSERKLSPILANMNPERARTVTIMLAEQRRLPELPKSN